MHCPTCGGKLACDDHLERLGGKCPECLLELGLVTEGPGFASGADFNGYKLVRQLGRGAMGVVYEAVQTGLRRHVALKLILDAQLSGTRARQRFRIEAEAASKLDHPNIVPIYEVGEFEGQPFLSMKLVRGKSLKDRIARDGFHLPGGVDVANLARFMAKIADAVSCAHQQGVIHRDLKPGNILVDDQGEPHLVDFGLAKLLEHEGQPAPDSIPGMILGTPSYMAPEQAAGARVSCAADVYSLGAIFYELLTGKPPFCATTALETLNLSSHEEPKQPRSLVKKVPRDLETICLKCLEKNPTQRYQSAAELAEDLESWLARRPIRARPAGPTLRLARWVRRNPLGAAFILVLCSALAASLALLISLRQQELLSNEIRATLEDSFLKEKTEMWANREKDYIDFDSRQLAMMGRRRAHFSSNMLRLTLALELDGDPFSRASDAAPVLALIEAKMQNILRSPVALNLRLQKHRPDVGAPTVNKEVDFQRLGPLACVRAKEAAPGIQLLVRERGSSGGVIFARRELGITNLAAIRGYRLAFAHTNSIVSFWAKALLGRAGITAKDLGLYQHMETPRVILSANSASGDDGELDETKYAHAIVIEEVLANKFDVGEARRHQFERNRHRGLVELAAFPVSPRVYVARSDLDPRIAGAFSQSLLSFHTPKEKEVLKRLYPSAFDGFDEGVEEELNQVRTALTNEISQFEGLH